jgi:hypothetical protein
MRELRRIDFGGYLQAFGLLFRNPSLVLAPFAAALIGVGIALLAPNGGVLGGLTGTVAGLVQTLLDSFALSVSLIVADLAWRRRGTVPFASAWEQARRKAPDILMAALGFNFILWAAGTVGSVFGLFGVGLILLALYFFIYTLPAAAIGGIPGSAAPQVSVERVQRTPAATFVMLVVIGAVYYGSAISMLPILGSLILSGGLLVLVLNAIIKAVGIAFVSLILAKGYTDASYGRF